MVCRSGAIRGWSQFLTAFILSHLLCSMEVRIAGRNSRMRTVEYAMTQRATSNIAELACHLLGIKKL